MDTHRHPPPQDEVRDVLTREWCDTLDVEDLRDSDDFFSVGGNSVLAVTLAERVAARLGIELPLEAIFIGGTFQAVLDACRQKAAPR